MLTYFTKCSIILLFIMIALTKTLPVRILEPVFIRNVCGFSSIILLQTRQKCAGGLSPGKYFSRSMQQNLPKRHVYTLVKTGSKMSAHCCRKWSTTYSLRRSPAKVPGQKYEYALRHKTPARSFSAPAADRSSAAPPYHTAAPALPCHTHGTDCGDSRHRYSPPPPSA